jgi:low affinity Fe/Cu permease
MAGKPISFLLAWIFVITWTIIGFIFGFSNTWLLVIDTIATLNASLMVFIIQNTQTRESKALHVKIDGLIKYTKEAEKELIALEEKEEEEIEQIKKKIFKQD